MDAKLVIEKNKLIAISRGFYGQELEQATLALYEGGIRAFEVTFEQTVGRLSESIRRTSEAISRLHKLLPNDAAIGAGTVMDESQVEAAYDAGASFIISPNTEPCVIAATKKLGMISIPGAMTPTEIAFAFAKGADIVKLFPAGILGVEYFKAVRAPLAHIPLAAVAGVTLKNISDFAHAGACAFGISSSLYIPDAVRSGDTKILTCAAKSFIDALNS